MKPIIAEKTTSSLDQQLSEFTRGVELATRWITDNQTHVPLLALEAKGMKQALRRRGRQARYLADHALKNPTLALYGFSQPEKIRLLNAMVADEQGHITTSLGGKTLDYFTHINPEQQNCDIVTRFSHQSDHHNAAWPVKLTLMSEADLVALLVRMTMDQNTNSSDGQPTDEQYIVAELQALQRLRQPLPAAGITSDEMVAISDFIARHCPQDQLLYERCFWPVATELAPYLGIDDRARLFALLWRNDATLTALWRQLAHSLQGLDHASQVAAPLSLLTDESQFPADALLGGDTVSALNQARDRTVQVCPLDNQPCFAPRPVSLAELTLLTWEWLIPLESASRQTLFNDTDILDIPGAGMPERISIDNQSTLTARLLGAKRALFLDHYSDQQAIDYLLVCQATRQRSDVKKVTALLEYWLASTTISIMDNKSASKPSLIWVIGQHTQHKNGNGCSYDEAVQRRIGSPGERWGTMLANDQAGIARMIHWLASALTPSFRQQYLAKKLTQWRQDLVNNRLADWANTQTPEDNRQQKQHIARSLLKTLQSRTGLHGELVERLQPPREALRQLYLCPGHHQRTDTEAHTATRHQFGPELMIDLLSEKEAPEMTSGSDTVPPARQNNAENDFAQQVMAFWINYLRCLPDNQALLMLLNLDRATLAMLTSELITASYRLNVTRSLQQALAEDEQHNSSRESKADRQVARALAIIGDFVAWLGFLQVDESQRPASRVNKGQKIFARPQTTVVNPDTHHRLTRLSVTPASTTAFYIYDWLIGLDALITDNSDYSAAQSLNKAQQEALRAALIGINAGHAAA